MKPFATALSAGILAGSVLLGLSASAHAQASAPTRSFRDIPLGEWPGAKKQERGVFPGIAAGSHEGIYIRFAEDIARLCSGRGQPGTPTADLRLNVFATEGGFDSLKRLRTEDEVQFAIVQSDLWLYAHRHGLSATSGGLTESENKIRAAWSDIDKNISVLLPLYEEKIHILVKPGEKAGLVDLVGLFEQGKRVNIGTENSGTRVTCTLLEELISKHMDGGKKWVTTNYDTDKALRKLLSSDPKEALDAVILVGGVPYPALDRFSLGLMKEQNGPAAGTNILVDLFRDNKAVPQLALLPFGRADQAIDADPDAASVFRGGEKVGIDTKKYVFMEQSAQPVPTRAITACLVTHRKYISDPPPPNEEHKILWVRHVLYRILGSLTPQTETGLVYGFSPLSDMWSATASNLVDINKGRLLKTSFGWGFHADARIAEMLGSWKEGVTAGTALTKPIDPESHF